MAFLKKQSLAQRIKQLKPTMVQIPPLLLFGMPETMALFTSTAPLIDISHNIKRELSALLAMNDHIEVTSLAANQLSYMLRAMTYKHEQTVKLIINPRILEISDFSFKWEQNLSFPFMKAFIGRYNSVKVSYVDRNFDELEETFSGEDARKVQQAFDQLNGFTLLDCRISRGEWALTDTFDKMVKTAKTLEFYRDETRKILRDHPGRFEPRTVAQLNKQMRDSMQLFSYEEMMVQRLVRYVKREYLGPLMTNIDQDEFYRSLKNMS